MKPKKKTTPGRPPQPRDRLGLTEQQHVVLRGILCGAPDLEIAAELGQTSHSVRAHRDAIYRALDTNSRAGVILEIIRRGGVDLDAVLARVLRKTT